MSHRIAWFNGEWLPEDSVRLGLSDWGILQAATVVDRLRTVNGQLLDVDEHLGRFLAGCGTLRIEPGKFLIGSNTHSANSHFLRSLGGILMQLVSKNASIYGDQDFCVVLLATPGEAASDGNGHRPTLLIHTTSIPWQKLDRWYRDGQPLVITDVCNVPASCWSPQLKTRARLQYFLADLEAKSANEAAGALLVDTSGNLTETSVGNMLLVEGNQIVSPPLASILHGVSLMRTLRLAEAHSIPVRFEPVDTSRALAADAILLCGTTGCLWRASCLISGDRKAPFKDSAANELVRALNDAWKRDLQVDFESMARGFASRGMDTSGSSFANRE